MSELNHKSKQEIQREQRQEHGKELRRAHFNLGFKEGFDEETRYKEFYKWFDLDQAEKTKQEMLKLRKDLRSTHYILGTDDPSKLFVSTATESFVKPQNPQISQLSVETKNYLRSHHFNLGINFIGRIKMKMRVQFVKIKQFLLENKLIKLQKEEEFHFQFNSRRNKIK